MNFLAINYQKRNFGLDVFRSIAILNVVYVHSYYLRGELFHMPSFLHIPGGVQLFFVLSGFLIGTILIKDIQQNGRLTISKMSTFWKRRWFRTLPNYYLFLLINSLIAYYAYNNAQIDQSFFQFIFFVQNLTTPSPNFFIESWSLSVEEWFYVFLPILLYLSLRIQKSKYAILTSAFILILFPLLFRISLSDEVIDAYWWDMKFRKVVFCRLDSLGFGVLAAFVKAYYSKIWYNKRIVFFAIGMCIVYLIAYSERDPNSIFTKVFFLSVKPISAVLLLPLADSFENCSIKWILKSVTFISVISYSMYLIHFSPLLLVIEKNIEISSSLDRISWNVIYWGVTIIGAAVVYRFFEKPMTSLRDK